MRSLGRRTVCRERRRVNQALVVVAALTAILVSVFSGGCGESVSAKANSPVTQGVPATATSLARAAAPTTTLVTAAPKTWTNLSYGDDLLLSIRASAMVYDSVEDKVLLFGGTDDQTGTDSSAYFNDTWSYSPVTNTWTNLNPPGSVPHARSDYAMVYDSQTRKVILFGGWDGRAYFGDTWSYNPATNTWTKLHPAGIQPTARGSHCMVYDSARNRVILFGGTDGIVPDLNDTWSYNPATNTWTKLKPSGHIPPGRGCHAMVYDSAEGKVILFGGWEENSDLCDTWAYDPAANTWTDLNPSGQVPAARGRHAMVYDSADHQVLMFGGSGTAYFSDTWVYDPAANTWTNLKPSGSVPYKRECPAMVYDSATGKVILFGGANTSGYFNDTWAYGGKS